MKTFSSGLLCQMSHIEPATSSRYLFFQGYINSTFMYMFTSDVVIWLNGEQMARSRPVTMVAVGQSKVPSMHVQFHYLRVVRKV